MKGAKKSIKKYHLTKEREGGGENKKKMESF